MKNQIVRLIKLILPLTMFFLASCDGGNPGAGKPCPPTPEDAAEPGVEGATKEMLEASIKYVKANKGCFMPDSDDPTKPAKGPDGKDIIMDDNVLKAFEKKLADLPRE